jgi:general secretion pathway protein K
MKILSNQRGIALLVVLSSIALLTLLMYAFQYETSINQIKSYNIQDHLQAKLNAQSGLQISLMRLDIYKEALNQLQQNPNLKKSVPPSVLNDIWSLPLMFPLPKLPGASYMDASFIDKFQESSWLIGQVQMSIESLGSKINLNMLAESKLRSFRMKKNKKVKPNTGASDGSGGTDGGGSSGDSGDTGPKDEQTPQDISKNVADKLAELLETSINNTKETDEQFYQKYSSKDIQYLVQAIKFYVSDDNTDVGPMTNQIDADFQRAGITPKHAPMGNISEVLLIPEWNDDLLNLIKNEISVYDSFYLDLNRMTDSFLRMLSPEITAEQIKQFFKLKSDTKANINFNGKEDFISFMSGQIRVDGKNLKENMEGLEKIGFKFTNSPNLFKVKAVGSFGRSEVTLSAIVLIPEKPPEPQTTQEQQQPPSQTKEKPVLFDPPIVIDISQS